MNGMAHIQSFPPFSNADANILILGSMPGKASLQSGQYYAHPRNVFWKIMSALLKFNADESYENRLDILRLNNIALWDVMKTCARNSSLDSDIVQSSIIINDFYTFFRNHPNIKYIFFNGATAETAFAKRVNETLFKITKNIHQRRLPSTSPANASMGYEEKLKAWQKIRNHIPVVQNRRN